MADDKKPPPGPPKPQIRPAPSASGPKPVTQPRVPAVGPPSGAKPVTQPRVAAAAPAQRPGAPKPVVQAKAPPPAPPPPKRAPGPLDLEQIYLVESDHDPTALLARRAGIDDGWLHWDDTNRDRVHRVGDVKQDGELVTVQTDRGFVYRFRPLTKELYDAKVREKVELSPAFGSTEELREFYRTAVM